MFQRIWPSVKANRERVYQSSVDVVSGAICLLSAAAGLYLVWQLLIALYAGLSLISGAGPTF